MLTPIVKKERVKGLVMSKCVGGKNKWEKTAGEYPAGRVFDARCED